VREWLPFLAELLGARKPLRVPRFVGRLLAGEAVVVMMTEIRGASNAATKRELGWQPRWARGASASPRVSAGERAPHAHTWLFLPNDVHEALVAACAHRSAIRDGRPREPSGTPSTADDVAVALGQRGTIERTD
jgi:hypothetical protein